jgi:uncharacterized protein (DUF433 family)
LDEDTLIATYVEANPYRPGVDEARLRKYGVAVWAIVGYLRAMNGDVDRVASGYAVPREAVDAALAYYCRHQLVVDARIDANVAAVA